MILTLFSTLTLGFIWIFFDALSQIKEKNSSSAISAITKLPPPALSANLYECRFRPYKDYRDHIYPSMKPIDYLGFVYAK